MNATEKLQSGRCKLLTLMPFYGYMALPVKWVESSMAWLPEKSRTIGVRVTTTGPECIWYKPFIDNLVPEEIASAVMHELEHLLRLHCVRVGGRDPKLYNIAADMCVNGQKSNPRIAIHDNNKTYLPISPDHMVWIPADWPVNETAEYYYDRMMEESDGNSGGVGESFDDHSIWSRSECSDEMARQIVQDMCTKAINQCGKQVPAHVGALLSKLSKPIVKWKELLRHFLGRYVGETRKSYNRQSRRNPVFGEPGRVRRGVNNVVVIVDTSGSISDHVLEQFFSEIEAICSNSKVSVMLWDTDLRGYWPSYRQGMWKNIKMLGRGGTDMAASLEHAYKNHITGDVTVLLTDGYTGYPPEMQFRLITCICTNDGAEPSWGRVIRMAM